MRSFAFLLVLACGAFAAGTASFHVDYATYLGGSLDETTAGITVDSAGSAYVVGTTHSPDFPLTSTDFGSPSKDYGCAFVTKLNAAGTGIVWSVCLGDATGQAVTVDPGGNVYVLTYDSTGTSSITKLRSGAEQMVYSKPLGASAAALAVDAAGNVYVVGSANTGFVTTHGAYQQTLAPGTCYVGAGVGYPSTCPDAFALKLDASGSLVYATYLGGSGPDQARAVAIDSQGNVWITGDTVSPNFPVSSGALESTFHGELDLGPLRYGDAFVAKLDPTGRTLLYSTYLGGSKPDAGFAIAVDGADAVYVAGGTQSADFPTTKGAFQRAYGGSSQDMPSLEGDAFVVKFNSSGSVVYATYVGGPLIDSATAIVVDSQGTAYINAYPNASTLSGMMLSVLSTDGSAIYRSAPSANFLAMDSLGAVYAAGQRTAHLFFPTQGAFQTTYGGGDHDASVLKLDFWQSASPWIASIVNAGDLGATSLAPHRTSEVAPGELITLFGAGFDIHNRVLFDGIAAPILSVRTDQIQAVVPFGINGSTTGITLQESAGQTFGTSTMSVLDAVPALFTLKGTGAGQAAALNQDGTVNSAANPAARGSSISLFLTGAGQMTPAQADGSLNPVSAPFPTPSLGVSCNVGRVQWVGAAPGMVAGVVQVNVLISEHATPGDQVPILIYVGNQVTGFTGDTTIAVR